MYCSQLCCWHKLYSDPCFRRLRSSPVTCCEWRRSTVSGTLCCSWARSLSWPSPAPSVSSGSRSDTKFNLGLKQIVTGAIQVLRNKVGDGVGGVRFPGKKRYDGVRFNVIGITRGWVGGQIPRKKRYVTLEWPHSCMALFVEHQVEWWQFF